MNEINRQVSRAQKRLIVGKFFRVFCWSLFAGLFATAIGLTIPKIWALDFLNSESAISNWQTGWIIGGVAAATLTAIGLTWMKRASSIDAALEVDKRFGLKERISSALSLDSQSASSQAGAALIEDANQRAQKIDVRDAFPFKPNWKALLPLFPALIVAALFFLPNALNETRADSVKTVADKKEKIQVLMEESKKKLKERVKKMEESGLKDAKLDFDSLGKKIDELDSKNTNVKKEALVKLNEIKKQLDDQKKQFGDAAEMKKKFNQLKRIEQGPAQQLNEALNEGNFEEAKNALKDLADKLKKGKLNNVEKKQLADNLQKMAKQVDDMVKNHEQQKQQLQDQIQRAMQNGDVSKAARLQEKLDKKQDQDRQMQKMQQMANKLQKAADAMKNQQQQQGNGKKNQQNNGQPKPGTPKQSQPQDGKKSDQQKQNQQGQGQPKPGGQPSEEQMKQAQQALEDLAEEMEKMQGDMDALEALEDLEQDLQECKNQMNGGGQKSDRAQWKDWGSGEGRGGGKRDRDDSSDTGHYRSRVKGKVQKGQTVVTGDADGENITGRTIAEARSLIQSSMSEKSDPLENQQLPRAQREHVKQYFEKLRGK